jgi:hypothetical protein
VAAVATGEDLGVGAIAVAKDHHVGGGLALAALLEILFSLKIPVVEGGSAELQEDLANARLWLNGAP